jgi:hypothetical protein
MPPVPFDGPVPELSPGGSYGLSRLLSCSFGLWPVHLVPADRSACGNDLQTGSQCAVQGPACERHLGSPSSTDKRHGPLRVQCIFDEKHLRPMENERQLKDRTLLGGGALMRTGLPKSENRRVGVIAARPFIRWARPGVCWANAEGRSSSMRTEFPNESALPINPHVCWPLPFSHGLVCHMSSCAAHRSGRH